MIQENTQRLLIDPETRPHAIVFLFAETLRRDDNEELEKFHRCAGSLMSGLTAIGGLTKVDIAEEDDKSALEQGRRIIAQIEKDHPSARRNFYTILPVVGQAAYGAQVLDDADLNTLVALVGLPERRLTKLLKRSLFTKTEYSDEPEIPPLRDRQRLWRKLDEYGTGRAIRGLRAGASPSELASYIHRESGVGALRDLVLSHFGNRAFLIKSRSTLGVVREKSFCLSQQLKGEPATTARTIAASVDRILLNEPRFREFVLLERYYSGTLK